MNIEIRRQWTCNRTRAARTAALVAVMLLGACDDSPDRLQLGFGDATAFDDHRELTVGWQSAGDTSRLAGTLYLPPESGSYAVMIMHPGSHRWTRDPWNPWFARLNAEGIAILEEIRAMFGSDFTIQLFADCNHTFVAGGGICEIDGPRVDWQTPTITWLRDVGFAR